MMHRIDDERLIWHKSEADALRERGKQEMAFQHREVVADADAWTSAKGQVRVTRQLLLALWRKALRLEFLRLREVLRASIRSRRV